MPIVDYSRIHFNAMTFFKEPRLFRCRHHWLTDSVIVVIHVVAHQLFNECLLQSKLTFTLCWLSINIHMYILREHVQHFMRKHRGRDLHAFAFINKNAGRPTICPEVPISIHTQEIAHLIYC